MKWRCAAEPLHELVSDYKGSIDIPEHQRPFIWNLKQQTSFIHTVVCHMPIPNLIFSETYENGKRIRWIEDGQQRFLTMKKFVYEEDDNGGVIKFNGKSFSELDIALQQKINHYPVYIIQYWDATQEERESLFDLYQNGVPLSTGQRYWHHKNKSQLVKFAIDNLMSPSSKYAIVAEKIWGKKDCENDTKTRLNLTRAVTFVCGAAFGVNFITKSFMTIGPVLNEDFDTNIAHDRLNHTLNTILAICEKCKFTKNQSKKLWDAGMLAGYVMYAYISNVEIDWVQFATACADFQTFRRILHNNKKSSRAWDVLRWKQGLHNISKYLENGLQVDEYISEDNSEDED